MSEHLAFRVDHEQAQLIRRAADASDTSVSSLLRGAALDRALALLAANDPPPLEEDDEC